MKDACALLVWDGSWMLGVSVEQFEQVGSTCRIACCDSLPELVVSTLSDVKPVSLLFQPLRWLLYCAVVTHGLSEPVQLWAYSGGWTTVSPQAANRGKSTLAVET